MRRQGDRELIDGDSSSGAFYDDVETVGPVVASSRDGHVRAMAEVDPFPLGRTGREVGRAAHEAALIDQSNTEPAES